MLIVCRKMTPSESTTTFWNDWHPICTQPCSASDSSLTLFLDVFRVAIWWKELLVNPFHNHIDQRLSVCVRVFVFVFVRDMFFSSSSSKLAFAPPELLLITPEEIRRNERQKGSR